MRSTTTRRTDYDRDVRELAQAIATLEVAFGLLAAERGPAERERLARRLRAHADRAVFERDGLEPVMLDRIADALATCHAAAS